MPATISPSRSLEVVDRYLFRRNVESEKGKSNEYVITGF
jgi:hypothetical protein